MAIANAQQALQQGIGHHQAGRFDQAEAIYRQLTAEYPQNSDAWHLLGVITQQKGNPKAAAELIGRAIDINPNVSSYHSNLGLVLLSLGEPEQAIASARRAIQIQPEDPQAHGILGLIYQKLQRLDEAVSALREALQLAPHQANIHNDLGAVYVAMKNPAEAEKSFREAIRCNPNLAEAHNNLGGVLLEKGQIDQAIAEYQTTIRLRPSNPQAQKNLSNALRRVGRFDEAADACNRAVQLNPRYANAFNNLGTLRMEQGRLDEAMDCFRRGMAIEPEITRFHSNLIFTMLFHPDTTRQSQAEEESKWRARHAEAFERNIQPHDNDRTADRPLRIGFVSPDFRDHSQAFFTVPLLSSIDRDQFEVYCYDDVETHDKITQRIQSHAKQWRRILGKGHDEVAKVIREDRIDILIDLTLHMERNRLLVFARKPAPVQATWLGYPGSTGLRVIDYRISDPFLDPVDNDESIYSEQTVRLPESFWCYDPLCDDLPIGDRRTMTFGSLNNYAKVNPPLLGLWKQVLDEVPGSRLMILCPSGKTRQVVTNLLGSERVTFADKCSRRRYLELYRQIDVVLDTFPYNGHTTTMDALWMGVPVVSMAGERAVSRGALSILSNMGLAELVASSPGQYVQIATGLMKDEARRTGLRRTLRQRVQASPVMDAPRFARNFQSILRTMWKRYCSPSSEPNRGERI